MKGEAVVVVVGLTVEVALGAVTATAVAGAAVLALQRLRRPGAGHESDAAHLTMSLAMGAMVVPVLGAHALRGVLTAVLVAFGVLLAGRVGQWWQGAGRPVGWQAAALAYHLFGAAAMWYVMAGHAHGGGVADSAGRSPVLVTALAVLFVLDALVLGIGIGRGGRCPWWHRIAHPEAAVPVPIGAVAGHVLMDVAMATMLTGLVVG